MTWTIFESDALRCRSCGLHRGVPERDLITYCVPGTGPAPTDLALVGEAPGEYEDEQGLPFVGRAGEMLDGCLHEAGITRAECYITNAVNCRPMTPLARNRKPTLHEIDCCRGYVTDRLAQARPRVIVALGDVALTSLLGKSLGGITAVRGRVTWSDELHAFIVPTFHPAYALRNYDKRQWIVEDLRLAKRVLEHNGPPTTERTHVDVITTIEQARAMRDDILAHDRMHFDVETAPPLSNPEITPVHLTKSIVFIVSFCVRSGHAYVVPLYLSGLDMCWSREELHELHAILVEIFSSEIRKGGWNVKFDLCQVRSLLGVWARNVTWCGMTAMHLLASDVGEMSLKDAAAMMTPLGRYDDELDQWLVAQGYTHNGAADHGKIWLAPDALAHQYAGMDSDASFRLEDVLDPRLDEMQVREVFVDECMPLVNAYAEIDREGVRINVPYLRQLSSQLGDALERISAEIVTTIGPEIASQFKGGIVNPASGPQVAKLLYDHLGFPIIERTEKGEPSTKKDVLAQFRDQHPVIPLLLAHRAHTKIKGTYVDGTRTIRGKKQAIAGVVDEDDYARMDTHLSRLVTFRFATTKPFAVHTFPKPKRGSSIPSVRALIIPRDGYKFIRRDYVAQEWSIQAVLANQIDMIEAILDHDEDVHEMVARELTGLQKSKYLFDTAAPRTGSSIEQASSLPYEHDGERWLSQAAYDDYKQQRTTAKNANFAQMFLSGPRKLSQMSFGCTLDKRTGRPCKTTDTMECDCYDRAVDYQARWRERFTEIVWWQYQQIKDSRRTGLSRNPFMTYRRLPAINDANEWVRREAERQCVNAPIQTTGAHLMRRAVLAIRARFEREHFPGRVVFTVHDEILSEVREDLLDEGDYIITVCMERPWAQLGGRALRTSGGVEDCWGG